MTIAFNPITGVFDLVDTTPNPPDTGGGYNWVTVVGETQAISAGDAYVATNMNPTTFSLPANAGAIVGNSFKIVGLGGGFTISQAADQFMIYGIDQTTAGTGGSLTSIDTYTCVEVTCVSTIGGTSVWIVTNGVGEMTVV